jgi:hypothetical protein
MTTLLLLLRAVQLGVQTILTKLPFGSIILPKGRNLKWIERVKLYLL